MKYSHLRRYYLASLLLSVGLLCGCSHSTTVVNTFPSTSTAVKLSVTSQFAHLEAGGLSVAAVGDSLVNFDLVPNISLTNDSNIALHLFAVWQIGTTISNAGNTVISLFDTVDLGTVAPQATILIDSIPIVTISENLLAGRSLSYNLCIGTLKSAFLASAADVFDSVPFNSRYRGIINTTESSPTPIAIFDGPDIADWVGDSIFTPGPAHPNPAFGSTFVDFTGPGSFPANPETLDSVRGNLYITPHHFVNMVSDSLLKSGTYTISLNLSGYKPGLYRLIWTAYKGNSIFTSHGDIMVPLQ